MHFIPIEGHIKHDTNCFCPVSFMLHLWIGNDNRKIGLVPCRKHPEQTSLTYYIAVEVCNREPNRVFRLMVHINTSFYLFFISRLLKAALKHDLRLIEPIGKNGASSSLCSRKIILFPLISLFIRFHEPFFYSGNLDLFIIIFYHTDFKKSIPQLFTTVS